MSCPICHQRKPKRYCPAKGEKICAVCCGTEREVTIDCPSDCPYLLAARRYEDEHRQPLSREALPYPEVQFPPDLVHERRPVVGGLGYTIVKFAGENRALQDADAFAALEALAETYRTLGSGLYYERPPGAALPQGLYGRLAQFLQDAKKEEAQRSGFPALRDTEIFYLLVFLLRLGRQRTNGRPRSRAFLDFLRSQFPKLAEAEREASRIILP